MMHACTVASFKAFPRQHTANRTPNTHYLFAPVCSPCTSDFTRWWMHSSAAGLKICTPWLTLYRLCDPCVNQLMTAAPPYCSNAHATHFSSRSLSLHGVCLMQSVYMQKGVQDGFITPAYLHLHTDITHLKT